MLFAEKISSHKSIEWIKKGGLYIFYDIILEVLLK